MNDTRMQKQFATRPEVETDPALTIFEQFQNETLRPILKQQNEVLIRIFRQYIIKHKDAFRKMSIKEKETYIKTSLRQDQHFRNFVRGIVAGLFTEEEWDIYINNEDELSKRMINLIEQRLTSQVKDL